MFHYIICLKFDMDTIFLCLFLVEEHDFWKFLEIDLSSLVPNLLDYEMISVTLSILFIIFFGWLIWESSLKLLRFGRAEDDECFFGLRFGVSMVKKGQLDQQSLRNSIDFSNLNMASKAKYKARFWGVSNYLFVTSNLGGIYQMKSRLDSFPKIVKISWFSIAILHKDQ
jgi:hypothetical protein